MDADLCRIVEGLYRPRGCYPNHGETNGEEEGPLHLEAEPVLDLGHCPCPNTVPVYDNGYIKVIYITAS